MFVKMFHDVEVINYYHMGQTAFSEKSLNHH